jgi:hypothetical protein
MTIRGCIATMLFLSLGASPFAGAQQQVHPLSYNAPPGYTGNWPFLDNTGSKLTDGVLGSSPLTQATAPNYVGWNISPTIQFFFAAVESIGEVRIGFLRSDATNIPLPPSLSIGTSAFSLTGNEIPDQTRGWVTFSGLWTGSEVDLSMTDKIDKFTSPTGFTGILVDEVEFYRATVVTPEPGTLTLSLSGLVALVVAVRRRRAKVPS